MKLPKAFFAALLFVSCGLVLSSSDLAHAATNAAFCNEKLGGAGDSKTAKRIACYVEKMQTLLDENRDAKRLRLEIERIRGKVDKNSRSPHGCKKRPNPPKVSGGVCGNIWNNFANHAQEYLRLTCKGWGELDDTVKSHLTKRKASLQKYRQCFSENISHEITSDFGITDRKSFQRVFRKFSKAEKVEGSRAYRFKELGEQCNAALRDLATHNPDLIRSQEISCKPKR